MNTEALLRKHLHAASEGISVTSEPATAIKRRVQRGRVLFGLAAAAVLVTVVGVIALVRGGDRLIDPELAVTTAGVTTTTPQPSTTTTLPEGVSNLRSRIAEVRASSTVSASFAAGHLVDGDLDTSWQTSENNGSGEYIEVVFTEPVLLDRITITNLQDETQFLRNFRVRQLLIDYQTPAGTQSIAAEVPDSRDPYTIALGVGHEGTLILRVASVWGSENVAGQVRFAELAMAEIEFYGSALPQATTTTLAPPSDVEALPQAWTEVEAERDVENFLAALAAGAYEQAAWPIQNNGGMLDGQLLDETPAEFLARMCSEGACSGPYSVAALGPGLVNESSQATSSVVVTHLASGEQTQLTVATFEGQRMVMNLPPLVSSPEIPGLVESLFGTDLPPRVVVQRFDAFEIWEDGRAEWVTNWWADDVQQVELDVALATSGVVGLTEPSSAQDAECGRLMTRFGQIVLLESCWSEDWSYRYLDTGADAGTPIAADSSSGDGEWPWFTERNGVTLVGRGDAEGNLVSLESDRGVDLAGDDYIGYLALSVDGSQVAYVDHGDDSAYSHFWSPVVVVKDVATGSELNRWVLDGPVLCLEFSGDWVVACEGRSDLADLASGMPSQAALTAINIESGVSNRVETRTRVFLPS